MLGHLITLVERPGTKVDANRRKVSKTTDIVVSNWLAKVLYVSCVPRNRRKISVAFSTEIRFLPCECELYSGPILWMMASEGPALQSELVFEVVRLISVKGYWCWVCSSRSPPRTRRILRNSSGNQNPLIHLEMTTVNWKKAHTRNNWQEIVDKCSYFPHF